MERAKRHLLLLFCFLAVFAACVQRVEASGKFATRVRRKVLCPTPSSIMLHSADGVYGMQWLVRTIEKHDLQTMTYRQVSELLVRGLCPPANAILVSLDDLGTSWLRQDFKDMIRVFTDKGFVLTLGVVTGTEESPQSKEIWDYLRNLQGQGVEVASHSARHSLLEALGKADLKFESKESYHMLCEELGQCPETFILPFGRGAESSQVLNVLNEDYTNIVSIHAPKIFGGTTLLFKRIPLVQEDDNPREPKLGAPYFIEIQTGNRKPRPQNHTTGMESQ